MVSASHASSNSAQNKKFSMLAGANCYGMRIEPNFVGLTDFIAVREN